MFRAVLRDSNAIAADPEVLRYRSADIRLGHAEKRRPESIDFRGP
jgi:hypothetical protein